MLFLYKLSECARFQIRRLTASQKRKRVTIREYFTDDFTQIHLDFSISCTSPDFRRFEWPSGVSFLIQKMRVFALLCVQALWQCLGVQ